MRKIASLYYDVCVRKGFHINKGLHKSEQNKYQINGRKEHTKHRTNSNTRE